MTKSIYILLSLLISGNVFCQTSIISESDIPKLDSIIKHLEKNYSQSETPNFYSLPQTSASYFEIITKVPNKFLTELKKSDNIEQLKNKFKGLQVDKDLLIIKNAYSNYKKEKKLQIKSFEIGKSQRHIIDSQNYDIQFFLNEKQNTRMYFSVYQEKWGKHKESTIIKGFYLNDDFKLIAIPKQLSDWINYTDLIVKPETSIFYDNDDKSNEFKPYKRTIIDSLVNYYELKTNKPPYRKEQDYIARRNELNEWQSKKEKFADSLYANDRNFKNLLLEALDYAEINKVSNGDLEDFTAQLISEKRALELMRQNRQVGTCSFDNGPIIQQKRIASLASKTQNWNVFIKSFLNIMNDNVSRNANSNIASNARKTYIEELAKLDIDIDKILLGSNVRIADTMRNHYFSDGSKIAKAYANLNSDKQEYFENTVFEIIKDKEIDAFNKLHFYNTLKNYQYFVKDSIERIQLEKDIENLIPFLPKEIKSRIENPNKQLYDLLYREKQTLDNFDIKSSIIANIYSYSFDGDCWQAELIDKNSDGRIIYDLTMAIGEEITPLQNFIDKKNELKSRVEQHSFLQQIINDNRENKVYIKFTTDKSFVNNRNRVTEDMPKELVDELDFENAISLYVSFPKRKYVRFVLLNNRNLLMLGIPKDFELPGYKFEDLMTKEEKSFLSTSYKSFKLFDEKGKMLN
ncbi:hypothetical protein EGM88_02965 [Aureibaculum marinum]|uniref:DUF3857 domain-containing protein n=1 Tax=Aureibaculum marinum TaxID=2487930 RepID=A0A3N4P6H6_9FLAO|nr:hypothetical protein [Aureibaculum marinum]RPE00241.1 hypothetical protein EGM88_02965 [Aureibaculum marinum]